MLACISFSPHIPYFEPFVILPLQQVNILHEGGIWILRDQPPALPWPLFKIVYHNLLLQASAPDNLTAPFPIIFVFFGTVIARTYFPGNTVILEAKIQFFKVPHPFILPVPHPYRSRSLKFNGASIVHGMACLDAAVETQHIFLVKDRNSLNPAPSG